jgi:hypothetical protein
MATKFPSGNPKASLKRSEINVKKVIHGELSCIAAHLMVESALANLKH